MMIDPKSIRELVGVREFRERLHEFEEPVTVVHTRGNLHRVGVWIPQSWVDKSAGMARYVPATKKPEPTDG
jgi:hypothetical protein